MILFTLEFLLFLHFKYITFFFIFFFIYTGSSLLWLLFFPLALFIFTFTVYTAYFLNDLFFVIYSFYIGFCFTCHLYSIWPINDIYLFIFKVPERPYRPAVEVVNISLSLLLGNLAGFLELENIRYILIYYLCTLKSMNTIQK